jgi:hypothetical protein
MPICEDWFFETYLPVARCLPGKKVLIRDNLSSHLSTKVIVTCVSPRADLFHQPPAAILSRRRRKITKPSIQGRDLINQLGNFGRSLINQ